MASENQISNDFWNFMQNRLGYNDEQMEKFKEDPRNHKVIQRGPDLVNKTVIFEVIESHGCNIEHKVGDQFVFSAEGIMLTHKCPKKVCPFILPQMSFMMFTIMERIYEGLDPLPLFNRGRCLDVGIDCGGWGNVIFETKIVDKEDFKKSSA